eukprot:04076.XXX_153157_153330_1 [CDS] Oithona nana genome sequencing.
MSNQIVEFDDFNAANFRTLDLSVNAFLFMSNHFVFFLDFLATSNFIGTFKTHAGQLQ